jgi:hypothetical protein
MTITNQQDGKILKQSSTYIRDQSRHHNAYVVDDHQHQLPTLV